jgi:aminoglycoside phosphotransferase family enzyme/predicted kinase
MSSTAPEPAYPPLIQGLLRPESYDHPVDSIRVIETHISWVLLAGEFAYKIKKPVDFGFLDFSTPDRRRFCCEEELRLNRRYAPELYLEVVPVRGNAANPHLGGSGTAIEYAVKMRRFDQAQIFDHLARARQLPPECVDGLAATVAAFHAAIDRATPGDGHGLPEHQQNAAEFNFTAIRPLLDDPDDIARLDKLRAWTLAEYSRLEPLLRLRKHEGFVRECHGDLHLGNIVLIDGRPTLFDGIEFSEDLRWIDVLSELAFLVMDLEVNGASPLASRLLNRYLEITGDYAGLVPFDYYRLYRAMVRAKIAQLTRAQTEDSGKRTGLLARYRGYVDYGLKLIQPRKPLLLITHGLSGSGKSHLAARLAEHLPAIRLRSDVERKRLAGFAAEARTGSHLESGIYGADMTENTYRHLAQFAEILLKAGHSVIVDATFLKREQRERQRRTAERSGAGFLILDCQAPVEVLKDRIHARSRAGGDPSEADVAVLENQIAHREALDEEERLHALPVNTSGELSTAELLERLSFTPP